MWSIDNIFVMDPHIMELQRLVELGKQMNLTGQDLLEFVQAKQALARDEIIRISQEKKEARIAAKAEKERIAAIEDDERIATEAERIRQRNKEDEARIVEEAARSWRHEDEEEKEKIGIHEEERCHLRREADNIRTRRMLQEVWKDAEERRREEEDEDECSISVTDRELWRKCFREQEALALEEAEELRQHGEYMLQRSYERLQWEMEDEAKKAEKTAELQQVMVIKTAEEEVMQHDDVVNAAEIQQVEVMKTVENEKMQMEKVMKTAAEDALPLEMVTPDSEVNYEAEDEGDASEQEVSLHPTDDDDEDGRMSEERERNDIGQVRGPSLPAPLVWRTSKMRCSSRQDHSRKRPSDERDRQMDGKRHSLLSKKSRFSSWARKKAGGIDVDEDGGSSFNRLFCPIARRYRDPSTGSTQR